MIRTLQGLAFLFIAIFMHKWQFRWENNPPFPAHWDAQHPYPLQLMLIQIGLAALIGVYLILTGEVSRWCRRGHVFSGDTFLSAVSVFLAYFLIKWSYDDQANEYLPPFGRQYWPYNNEGMVLPFGFLIGLALLCLLRGEWRWWKGVLQPASSTANATST
jgi:hypothetical protein